jgi:hypothetical protein
VTTPELKKCDRCGKMVDAVFPHSCTPLALTLAAEWRPTMPPDVVRLWAPDVVAELRRLAAVEAENEALRESLRQLIDGSARAGAKT